MRGAQAQRSAVARRAGVLLTTLLTVATVGVVTPRGGGANGATVLLHTGSVVTPRDVVQVDMSSWRTGLGVAVVPPVGANEGHEYLVATTDGGVRWTVRSVYTQPVGNWYDAPSLLVAGNGDLYAADQYSSRLDLSTDGGATWTSLHLQGRLESAKLVGDGLWTTTMTCHGAGSLPTCTSQLAVYRVGQLAPLASHAIPGSTQHVGGVAIFGVVGSDAAVVTEGFSEAYWPMVHFVVTADGGASWRSAIDPCARPLPGRYEYQVPQPLGLDVSPEGRWTLYRTVKFLGSSGGYNALYTSTTAGRTWRLLARSRLPGVRPVGRLDGVSATTFGMSNDGQHLWKVSPAASGQTVGTVSESADGGLLWTAVKRPTSAGSHGVDPVGASGAFLTSLGQGLWRTEDGVHWTFVR